MSRTWCAWCQTGMPAPMQRSMITDHGPPPLHLLRVRRTAIAGHWSWIKPRFAWLEPASRFGAAEGFDRSTSPGNYPRRIYAAPIASAELSRRVEKVVAYPPLSEISDLQRREFHEALLDTDSFEDLPGRWQAANLKAEQNRTNLRIVTSD
jgi:hypothetical protein